MKIPETTTIDFEKYKSANNGKPVEGEEAFPEAEAVSEEPELD